MGLTISMLSSSIAGESMGSPDSWMELPRTMACSGIKGQDKSCVFQAGALIAEV